MNGLERRVAGLAGVTHRYGSVLALDDITLDIPEGSLVGVIGPDGVGKSTRSASLRGQSVFKAAAFRRLTAT